MGAQTRLLKTILQLEKRASSVTYYRGTDDPNINLNVSTREFKEGRNFEQNCHYLMSRWAWGRGIYMTEDKSAAKGYGTHLFKLTDNPAPNLLKMDAKGMVNEMEAAEKAGYYDYSLYIRDTYQGSYDGVEGYKAGRTTVVLFNPKNLNPKITKIGK